MTKIQSNAFKDCCNLIEVINKSSLSITAGSSRNGSVAYYAIEVHSGTTKIVNQNGYLFYTLGIFNYLVYYTGAETEISLPENYIEADILVKALDKKLGNELRKFHTGISYRHCMILKNGNEKYDFARPHDHLGEKIGPYLPKTENGGAEFLDIMKKSFDILNHHP